MASTMIAYGEEDNIRECYENREFGKAIREIMRIADAVNQHWDKAKPWELAKDPAKHQLLHDVCSDCLDAFRILTFYLAPILPDTAANVAKLFGFDSPLTWADLHKSVTKIAPYQHLMTRVDAKQLDALFEPPSAAPAAVAAKSQKGTAVEANAAEQSGTISIDEFAKLDLRIARIANAEHVEGADKLIKLTLDMGAMGTKQVFAGIKSAYDPENLKGRLTVMVANLAPRKMKFGLSEGMVLAASGEKPGIFLLSPDSGAEPGMKVK
jgi:methionyl-tRNA synthetase